jgi:hypothetical protein
MTMRKNSRKEKKRKQGIHQESQGEEIYQDQMS